MTGQPNKKGRKRALMASNTSRTMIAAGLGTDVATYTREAPGMSAFGFEDGVVYHTYSACARGLDGPWGMYQWLDRAAGDAPDAPWSPITSTRGRRNCKIRDPRRVSSSCGLPGAQSPWKADNPLIIEEL